MEKPDFWAVEGLEKEGYHGSVHAAVDEYVCNRCGASPDEIMVIGYVRLDLPYPSEEEFRFRFVPYVYASVNVPEWLINYHETERF